MPQLPGSPPQLDKPADSRSVPLAATSVQGRDWHYHGVTLELADGTPADPPRLDVAVPNWSAGDTIPLGPGRMVRVVRLRDDDADQPPVLVVEDVS
jgi:hypothetical protein